MKTTKAHIGVVRSLPRYPATAQRAALEQFGCGSWIDLTAENGVESLISMLRRGDVVHVRNLALLARPKHRTDDNPRLDLWAMVHAIEARGASILETSTGRRSSISPQERDEMIRDALEAVTKGMKALPRRIARENGILGGRPQKWTADDVQAAAPVWFDPSLWGKKLDDALRRGGHPPRSQLGKVPPRGLGPRGGHVT